MLTSENHSAAESSRYGSSHQDSGLHVCGSSLAFVLQANPSDREEILGRHLPQVIIEVPVTQRPLHTAIHSAEKAVFRPLKQESAIKSCTCNNKSNVGDGEWRRDESPQRLANRTNVT
ncbi:hypothetical protein Q5P01_014897 [Channa striata]|uniref:Uncharacterized protein n=1 Tax=Channa striata TaxID=64152 RepID=A0AA88MGD7_CHASR|nr:hypothetical protein Q5P01_014897 [Channa striata]